MRESGGGDAAYPAHWTRPGRAYRNRSSDQEVEVEAPTGVGTPARARVRSLESVAISPDIVQRRVGRVRRRVSVRA
ncbi:hypothetical protein GCM10010532_002340 [Dactylosporangium siamense]|uniref:Uncharacterized protein n=1 Tax=Dactylosporangium siamense TaxID=685454 RepID=A0A919UAB0_9ACTN|nr:hypothetical protein Dsi01nite_023320 [Dactylosporangium siamense]